MVGSGKNPVEAVRHFSRFFTSKMGVLRDRLLESDFSPTEARVIFELGYDDTLTARDLADLLGFDPGYLSRVLGGLKRRGLVAHAVSETDRRRQILSLSDTGRAALNMLEARSRAEIGEVLRPLEPADQQDLLKALEAAERLLTQSSGPSSSDVPIIRPHRAGELLWVLARQAVLYVEEYGWNGDFERYLLSIGHEFVETFNPADACLWIAEHAGVVSGSAAVVRAGPETARLRIVYVEPAVRGLGLGHELVRASMNFAQSQGYREMVLSTYSVLAAARRVYEVAGFELYAEEPEQAFGKSLTAQHWRLDFT